MGPIGGPPAPQECTTPKQLVLAFDCEFRITLGEGFGVFKKRCAGSMTRKQHRGNGCLAQDGKGLSWLLIRKNGIK